MTPAALKAALPEFAAIDDAVVQRWLDSCKTELNADRWGAKYDEAHMLLTAHTMVRMGVLKGGKASAQPTGAISAVTVGPVSRSFAVAAPKPGDVDDLELTPYGQLFKRKRRWLLGAPRVM